ncbi:MAG TPA: DUF2551 domain-containing protein [Candidatus Methanoculleus thermohydrogenotrophicum]|jgi:hypothetical protein|nr:DUF2551 domain-containing protein [Candidatus Methanoculleus thermohydrogenotrophicum]NLM81840.1 DUF2551 domain-containing protein [Candidatus Methanoculleus thermohydrogenotrophicum]HOB17798.1 DUF2551 domain-containing protein [Candidatus Methanoculleus thermohydrogenotrophicum]HPZ38018.1 DUF2551 domain-containing protein [Candidatus Methanoculleus thermohydrogenotrophicum]HQC91216.1 DUF2551 domain-containing protein [Candidatus Methanoculleus thermohydrogenotrophicum]
MRSPSELKLEIETRLEGYLSRDRDGIRHELLSLFVKARSLTIPQVYEKLQEQFSISYRSVASMVGTIASRIGILHVRRNAEGTNTVYELKDQYVDVVTDVLGTT